MWQENIAALAREHRVYALDLVGFGRTEKPKTSYTMDYLAGFVLRFMDALGIDRATLVGNSMGGGIAMLVAGQAPGRVDKLVLVSPVGLGRTISPILRLMAAPILGELMTRPGEEGVTRMMRASLYHPARASAAFLARATDIALLPGGQAPFLGLLRSLGTVGGLKHHALETFAGNLPRIQASTLVVWGRQDRILPVAHAATAMAGLRRARLHLLDEAGHFPHMDQPERFNAAVLDFLGA